MSSSVFCATSTLTAHASSSATCKIISNRGSLDIWVARFTGLISRYCFTRRASTATSACVQSAIMRRPSTTTAISCKDYLASRVIFNG